MVVSDTTIIIAIGVLFSYLVIYRKNEFFGNISFIAISIATWYFGTTTSDKVIGMVMFFGSLISMIYDLLKD